MSITKENSPATPKQLWALKCITGLNTTRCTLSMRTASNLIDLAKNGTNIESDLRSYGATGSAKVDNSKHFQDLYNQAHEAGLEAGNNKQPRPMVVNTLSNPLDDSSVCNSEFVSEGVCGFAWVNIKPGNSSFANWLKKNNLARKDSYYGGVTIWVSHFGQSYERKIAYANAFAKVIQESGIKRCYVGSRLD